jgi:hypothetical protein
MSRGEKARRIFRQLERVVRTHAVEYLINKYKKHYMKNLIKLLKIQPTGANVSPVHAG